MHRFHPLLALQLRDHLGISGDPPDDLRAFLDAVNRAYARRDQDQNELEAILEQRTRELLTANQELRALVGDMESRVKERTRLYAEVNDRLVREAAQRKRAEAKYRGIFENSAEGMFQSTMNGRLVSANPAMAHMLGYATPEELISAVNDLGADLYARAEDRDRYLDALLREGRVASFEAEFHHNDGTLRWGRLTAVLVRDAADRPLHIEGTCADVSGRKEFELALRAAKEKAEELSRLKSNLLSMVSHELRTPLTSILGYSKIITRQFDKVLPLLGANAGSIRATERILANLSIIHVEARRLTELINNVLDLAKLESGSVEWRMESVSLEEVLAHSLDATRVLFRERGLALDSAVATDVPPVLGDRDRLVQVCINLLSNAAKFSDQGTVRCCVTREGGMVCVSVADQGVGIPGDALDSVFAKFKQVDDTLTGRPRGTGLGLSICKEIVEQHGGSISVQSTPGLGSTFRVTLPVHR
ncbi:MAG: PAS domain-containing sensor histidine kinase [Desulfovibrionaceae bacterium]|jgi:PAS domain S-box-containing protein|nr:PAS domain-containing sensor histidine kinase [Desulfovibrionaceae bacterium]